MASDAATWIGVVLSGVGAVVALWQACLARSYKEQVRVDIRKLNVLRCTEHLKKALEAIRQLPSDSTKIPRGRKTQTLVVDIKECFDEILGILPIDGAEEDVRKEVTVAQEALTFYEEGFNTGALSPQLTNAIQGPIQNAVSLANDRILKIEGKA